LPENDNGGDFQPLPAGWYSATITGAELRDTKKTDENGRPGQYIRVTYDVTGPTHQGRKVWGNLNVSNSNEKAEQIGRQQLGELMRAGGLARVKDTDELLGVSLEIKVKFVPAGEYPAGNDVAGWRAVKGSYMPKPQPAAPAPSASNSAPPWAK
jgi:hypothetical protein